MSSASVRYYRMDILQAAKKKYGANQIAFEEMDGVFRIRSVRTPLEFGFDVERGVRTAYETSVRTHGGPWGSLAEAAQFFGVEKR